MANLGIYYGLCPLIDQKSLLGVVEDETEGFVIVTLGKNMAIKYKLSDQKQIHSWSTKDHLTSQIVYDKGFNQYAAVFDHKFIRIFGSDCENLDRIKKYKFHTPIHSLVSTKTGTTLVLFKNGTISGLKYALDNRKIESQNSILDNNDVIESYDTFTFDERHVISLLVKCSELNYKFVIIHLTENNEREDTDNIIIIKFKNLSTSLSGHLLISKDDCLNLVTLWSDGKLHVMPLNTNQDFPGPLLSIVDSLSCKNKVCMLVLSSTYIALYGADKHEEGASLVVYNVKFKVSQCKQAFKLYSVGSKMYLIRYNILLTVGNHLAVLPYQLATEQLAALVGSHRHTTNDDVLILTENVDWGEKETKESKHFIPKSIKKLIENLQNEGYPEQLICAEVIPKILANKNINNLVDALKYFTEVPESLIVDLILFVINSEDNVFGTTENLEIENCPIQPIKRCELLNKILELSYNDILIIPYLREKLQVPHSLKLLNYICFLLNDNKWTLNNELVQIQSELKIIEWGSLLLDAHYQKLLLSKDEHILKVLKLFYGLVDTHIVCINENKLTATILDSITRGKSYSKSKQIVSKWYSIEQMSLY